MIRNALQTPELAYAAISIGLSVCLLFAVLVFFQSRRSRKDSPPSENPKVSESKNESRKLVSHWSPWRSVGALFLWKYYRGAPDERDE